MLRTNTMNVGIHQWPHRAHTRIQLNATTSVSVSLGCSRRQVLLTCIRELRVKQKRCTQNKDYFTAGRRVKYIWLKSCWDSLLEFIFRLYFPGFAFNTYGQFRSRKNGPNSVRQHIDDHPISNWEIDYHSSSQSFIPNVFEFGRKRQNEIVDGQSCTQKKVRECYAR